MRVDRTAIHGTFFPAAKAFSFCQYHWKWMLPKQAVTSTPGSTDPIWSVSKNEQAWETGGKKQAMPLAWRMEQERLARSHLKDWHRSSQCCYQTLWGDWQCSEGRLAWWPGNTTGQRQFENTAQLLPTSMVPCHSTAQIDPGGLTLPPTASKQPVKLQQLP